MAPVALAVAAILASAPTTFAQQPAGVPRQDPTWVPSPGWAVTLFPSGDLYPVYVADPHRPTNVLAESFIVGGGISNTPGPLTRLAAGGRFGMLRFGSDKPDGRAFQVSLEAGFDALFDLSNQLDVAGWDGNYGLTLTTASSRRLALKIAMLHVSAHAGDEFEERTGINRSNYTREEFSVGVAWRFPTHWRAYGETAAAYHLGGAAAAPWRAQSGIEYESCSAACGRRIAYYAAIDVATMEERNWRIDTTADVGMVLHGQGRSSRIFFEWHDGRPTVTEFFQDSVSSLSFGLKIDL